MTEIDIKMDNQQLRDYVGSLPSQSTARGPQYTTIIFETEDEYKRFYKQVFDQFEGKGLRFTNVPIPRTTRVSSWLLEQTHGRFDFRAVTQEDLEKAAKRLEGRKPFDPKNIDYFLPIPKPRNP